MTGRLWSVDNEYQCPILIGGYLQEYGSLAIQSIDSGFINSYLGKGRNPGPSDVVRISKGLPVIITVMVKYGRVSPLLENLCDLSKFHSIV